MEELMDSLDALVKAGKVPSTLERRVYQPGLWLSATRMRDVTSRETSSQWREHTTWRLRRGVLSPQVGFKAKKQLAKLQAEGTFRKGWGGDSLTKEQQECCKALTEIAVAHGLGD
ncbi:hypothetical protein JCM24511_07327 [Saitozyma sp. JCM 24511]|nr:hypothetical protein JCM24511_07327 [Saitozyma sp. JCM 24511]